MQGAERVKLYVLACTVRYFAERSSKMVAILTENDQMVLNMEWRNLKYHLNRKIMSLMIFDLRIILIPR